MNVSIDMKRAEAVKRMKALGIFPQTVRQFEKQGLVSVSEPPFGAFYWVDDEDRKHIREFEERYDALVYVVVRAWHRELGKMDAYLYVSDSEDEWEWDMEDLKNGCPLAYCFVHDAPQFSEIGSIGIEVTSAAGLKRTA